AHLPARSRQGDREVPYEIGRARSQGSVPDAGRFSRSGPGAAGSLVTTHPDKFHAPTQAPVQPTPVDCDGAEVDRRTAGEGRAITRRMARPDRGGRPGQG